MALVSSLLTGNNYFICNCSIKIALRAKVKLVSLMVHVLVPTMIRLNMYKMYNGFV